MIAAARMRVRLSMDLRARCVTARMQRGPGEGASTRMGQSQAAVRRSCDGCRDPWLGSGPFGRLSLRFARWLCTWSERAAVLPVASLLGSPLLTCRRRTLLARSRMRTDEKAHDSGERREGGREQHRETVRATHTPGTGRRCSGAVAWLSAKLAYLLSHALHHKWHNGFSSHIWRLHSFRMFDALRIQEDTKRTKGFGAVVTPASPRCESSRAFLPRWFLSPAPVVRQLLDPRAPALKGTVVTAPGPTRATSMSSLDRHASAASAAAVAAVSSAATPAVAAGTGGMMQPAAASVSSQAAPTTLPSRLQPTSGFAAVPSQLAPLPPHLASMVSGEFRRRLASQSAQQIAQAVLHTERFGSAATARGGAATTKRPAPPVSSTTPSPDALLLLPALLRLLPPPGIPLDFRSLPCLWALDRQRRGGASLGDLEALVARSSRVLMQIAQQDSAVGGARKVQTPAHAKAILAAQQIQQMYADLCEIDDEATAAAAAAESTNNASNAPSASASASAPPAPVRVSFTHWFLSLIVHAHPTASFKHVGLRVLYLHRAALELLWELLRPMLLVAPAAATAAAAAATTNSSSRARQLDALSAASAAGGAAQSSASASSTSAMHAASQLQLVALESLLAFSSAFAPCSASASAAAAAAGVSAITPAAALGCSSFQSFFNLLQLVSERAGLLDLEDEILDHYIPLLVVEKMCQSLEKGIKEMMRGVRGEVAAAVKKQPPLAAATAVAAASMKHPSAAPDTTAPIVDASPVFIIHTDLELVGSGTAGGGSSQQGSSFVTPRPPSSGRVPAVGTPSPPKQPRPLQHQSSLLALPLSLSLGLMGSSPELGSFRGSSGASSAQPSERGGVTAGPSSVPVMAHSHRGSVMQPLLRNIAEEAAGGACTGGGGMVHSSESMLQQLMVDPDDAAADELMRTETGGDHLGSPSHAAESARVRSAAAGAGTAAPGDSDDFDQLLRRSSLAGGSSSARAGFAADDLLTPTSSASASARPLGSATAPRRHPGVPSLSFGHAGRTAVTAGPASDQPQSGHIGHTRDPSATSAGRLANGAAWPASVASPPMMGHSHSSSVPSISMPLSAASTTMGPLSAAGRSSHHNHLGDSSNSSAGTSLAHTPLTSPTGASYAAHLLALNPRRSTNPTARSSYGGMEFLSALGSSGSSLGGSINNSTRGSAQGVVPSLALALQGLNRGGSESPQKSAQSTFSPGLTYTQRMQHGLLHSPHATPQGQQQHLIVGAMSYGSPTRGSPSFPAVSPIALPSPYLTSQRSPHPLMTPHRAAGNAPESSRFANMGPRNAELDGPLPLSHAALLSSASKLVGGASAAAAAAAAAGGVGRELSWPQHHIVHDIDLLSEQQVQQLINDGGDDGGDDSDDAGFGATSADDGVALPSDDEADDADADADADDAALDEDEEVPAAHARASKPAAPKAPTLVDSVARTAPSVAPIKLALALPPTATKIVIETPAKAPAPKSSNTSSSGKPTSPEIVELHRKPTSKVSKAPAKVAAPSSSGAAGAKSKSPALSRQSSTAGLAAAAAGPAVGVPEKKKGVTFRPSLSKGKSSVGGGGGPVSAASSATTPPSTAAPAAVSPAASAASPAAPVVAADAAPASGKPPLTLMISNSLPVRGAITTPTATTASAASFAFSDLTMPAATSGSNVHPFGATHSPEGKGGAEPFAAQLDKASSASNSNPTAAAAAAPLIQPIPRA